MKEFNILGYAAKGEIGVGAAGTRRRHSKTSIRRPMVGTLLACLAAASAAAVFQPSDPRFMADALKPIDSSIHISKTSGPSLSCISLQVSSLFGAGNRCKHDSLRRANRRHLKSFCLVGACCQCTIRQHFHILSPSSCSSTPRFLLARVRE